MHNSSLIAISRLLLAVWENLRRRINFEPNFRINFHAYSDSLAVQAMKKLPRESRLMDGGCWGRGGVNLVKYFATLTCTDLTNSGQGGRLTRLWLIIKPKIFKNTTKMLLCRSRRNASLNSQVFTLFWSSTMLLRVRKTYSNYGDRCFAAAGP